MLHVIPKIIQTKLSLENLWAIASFSYAMWNLKFRNSIKAFTVK